MPPKGSKGRPAGRDGNVNEGSSANGIVSQLKSIACGVPQGNVCGPLLFLLYINDISKSLKQCEVSLYADDTVLYYSSKDLRHELVTVQEDLTELSNWSNINKLTIDCKKN